MDPQDQAPPVTLPERLWAPTDDFKCTPPRPDGDIWANCLAPLREADKKQCAAWREEVQNLLIFAGLFSAVVTTFVVDSYKNLQPSPDQSSNTTSPSSFSPTHSWIRVNALWFASLVISLTAVLVGIVSLQWIREYESYEVHLTPRQIFALRNMRHEAMNKWFVPHIFTSLPLILQAALILFFIGLMDFLLHLYPPAAIPTTIIISVTLLFLLLTTLLPALQYYLTVPSNTFGTPTTPFPYKSPQSWIFQKMIQVALRLLCPGNRSEIVNWNGFDLEWVCNRTYQALKNEPRTDTDFRFERVPDDDYPYDAAHGVAHVLSNYSQSNTALTHSAYHGFLEHNKGQSPVCRWNPESQSWFLRYQPVPGAPVLNSEILPEGSTRDTSLLLFLRKFWGSKADPSSYRQQWELLIRTSSNFPNDNNLLATCGHVLRFTILNWTSKEESRLDEIFHEDLTSQLVLLYQQSVNAALLTDDDGPGSSPKGLTADDGDPLEGHSGDVYFARMVGILDGRSNPSFVRFRELMEPLHAALAEKILQSRTATVPSERLAFAHRLGCAFVHHILFDQPRSLPEWSETYKESIVFLITALSETASDSWHQSTYYNHNYWKGQRAHFLSQISQDICDRIGRRCADSASEGTNAPPDPDNRPFPASKPPRDSHVADDSTPAVTPGLRRDSISTSPAVVPPPHEQRQTLHASSSDEP